MKPIKEIQEAVNNLKGYYYIDDEWGCRHYPYGKEKSYTENVNAIQKLIDEIMEEKV